MEKAAYSWWKALYQKFQNSSPLPAVCSFSLDLSPVPFPGFLDCLKLFTVPFGSLRKGGGLCFGFVFFFPSSPELAGIPVPVAQAGSRWAQLFPAPNSFPLAPAHLPSMQPSGAAEEAVLCPPINNKPDMIHYVGFILLFFFPGSFTSIPIYVTEQKVRKKLLLKGESISICSVHFAIQHPSSLKRNINANQKSLFKGSFVCHRKW